MSVFFTTKYRPHIFWALLMAILGLVILYIYFINSSVFNIISIKKDEDKISILESTISTLESRYIALSSNLTLERAKTLGLADASRRNIFVVRKNVAVSFNQLPHGAL